MDLLDWQILMGQSTWTHIVIWFRMRSWRKMSYRLVLKYCRHWTKNTLIVVWSMTALCFMTATHGGTFALFVLILSETEHLWYDRHIVICLFVALSDLNICCYIGRPSCNKYWIIGYRVTRKFSLIEDQGHTSRILTLTCDLQFQYPVGHGSDPHTCMSKLSGNRQTDRWTDR